MTWQVTRSGVDEALELLPDCIVLDEAIARWAAGIPLNERERVTNEVFDALGAGGATRFDEIAKTPEGLQQVLRALGSTDERTRDLVRALVDSTATTSAAAVRKATSDMMEEWARTGREIADGAARLLQQVSGEIRVPVKLLGSTRESRGKAQ